MIKKIKTNFKRFATGKSGFSLVELIVVISIMAVLTAILAPTLVGYVERSRAQKDTSQMSEVVNSARLTLGELTIYDEMLPFVVADNFSCYADGNTETNIDANKIITKQPDHWIYEDAARKLDETPYKPDGKMRGLTITIKPSESGLYTLKDGVVNQMGDESTKKGNLAGIKMSDPKCEGFYNRLRSSIGDTLQASSSTYKHSDYTIFIRMGTTGGNQAENQDAIEVWGQFNGTNLPDTTGSTSVGAGTQTAPSGQPGGGGGAPAVTLPAKGKTLEEYTWAEVQQIVQSGKATEYGFTVGSTKTLQINGFTKTATIIGLNHQGDGENTATFMVMSSIATRNMTSDGKNAGGWEQSAMRTWLNSTILNSMSNKNQIKTVNKKTNNTGYQSTSTTETSDSVFLLSPIECGFACPASYEEYSALFNAEGSVYEWFNGHSTNTYIWLRSAAATNKNNFFCYGNDGKLYGSDASNEYSVFPAFVIG